MPGWGKTRYSTWTTERLTASECRWASWPAPQRSLPADPLAVPDLPTGPGLQFEAGLPIVADRPRLAGPLSAADLPRLADPLSAALWTTAPHAAATAVRCPLAASARLPGAADLGAHAQGATAPSAPRPDATAPPHAARVASPRPGAPCRHRTDAPAPARLECGEAHCHAEGARRLEVPGCGVAPFPDGAPRPEAFRAEARCSSPAEARQAEAHRPGAFRHAGRCHGARRVGPGDASCRQEALCPGVPLQEVCRPEARPERRRGGSRPAGALRHGARCPTARLVGRGREGEARAAARAADAFGFQRVCG